MGAKRITLHNYIVDNNINNRINELLLKYKGYKVYNGVFSSSKENYRGSDKVHV